MDCGIARGDVLGRRWAHLFERATSFAACTTVAKWKQLHAAFGAPLEFFPFIGNGDLRSLSVGRDDVLRFPHTMVKKDDGAAKGGKKTSHFKVEDGADGRRAASNCAALRMAAILYQLAVPESWKDMPPRQLKVVVSWLTLVAHQSFPASALDIGSYDDETLLSEVSHLAITQGVFKAVPVGLAVAGRIGALLPSGHSCAFTAEELAALAGVG